MPPTLDKPAALLDDIAIERIEQDTMVITGWALTLVGTALWLYGYFAPGHQPLFDWQAHTPGWIADYIPNIESEIGLVLLLVAMVPIYWPRRASSEPQSPNGG